MKIVVCTIMVENWHLITVRVFQITQTMCRSYKEEEEVMLLLLLLVLLLTSILASPVTMVPD